MKPEQVIREAAREANIPLTSIGIKLGKTKQYVHSVFSNGDNPKMETIGNILQICGYKLCAVPSGKVSADMMVIDDNDAHIENDIPIDSSKQIISNIFDWEKSNEVLASGESLYRVHTTDGNDSIYLIASNGVLESEIRDHVDREMTKHFGKKGPSMVESIERIYLDGDLIG